MYQLGGTVSTVATSNPRVQVTVDAELSEALAAVEGRPSSKSRLIRDLALRGARAVADERSRQLEAREYLLGVARGEVDLDLGAARALHESRDDGLP